MLFFPPSQIVELGLDPTDTNKTKLDIYEEHFEKPFLKATQQYYQAESEKFVAENGIVEYLKKASSFFHFLSQFIFFFFLFYLFIYSSFPIGIQQVEKRIAEEETRIQRYLHQSTSQPLLAACDSHLIAAHKDPMNEEFKKLLAAHQVDGELPAALFSFPFFFSPPKKLVCRFREDV